MLRRIWRNGPADGREVIWIARGNAAPISDENLVNWAPGAPLPALPAGACIAALWGVTPGPGRRLAENVDLALAAQRLARRISADRVIHCSSSAIYAARPEPQDETARPAPANAYGAAKLAMEQALHIRARALSGEPATCVLRLTNVAGADSLFAALDGSAPVVLDRFADGTAPARSYLAPADLAAVLLGLADCPVAELPALLNVAGPAPVAMDVLLRTAGRPFDWRPAPDTALASVHLDTCRLTGLFGSLPDSADAMTLIRQWREFGEPAA